MSLFFAQPVSPLAAGIAGPLVPANAAFLGGRVHAIITQLDLAAQAALAVGDYIDWGGLPKGAVPIAGLLTSSVSLGTSTIDVGKYVGSTFTAAFFKAAATFTAVDTPTPYGKAANLGVELAAATRLRSIVAVAALPGAGKLTHTFLYTTPHGG